MTEEFVRKQIDQFQQMTSRGYTPPVLKDHRRNGERYGAVVALLGEKEDGVWKLKAGLHLYEPDAAEKVDTGQYNYVSGGWSPLLDDEGTSYENALIEVSLTPAPHVKVGQDVVMSELLEERDMEEVMKKLAELAESMKDVSEKQSKLSERLEAMEKEKEEMKEKEEEEMKEEKDEKEEMKSYDLLAQKVAEVVMGELRKGRREVTAVPPEAKAPVDNDSRVFMSEESLEQYAKEQGVSVLALLGDPNIKTQF